MSTFDESAIRRQPAGITGGGQFATQPRAEADVTLGSPDTDERAAREAMRRDDPEGYAQVVDVEKFERASAHWSPANQARAVSALARMDGVEGVELDPTDPDDRERGLVKVGDSYGKSGTLTYKGRRLRFTVRENVGTVSGSGFVSVLDDEGRELGTATYSVPRTEGGYASVGNGRLGDSIEEGLLARRLRKPLAEEFSGVRTPRIVAFGGRAALSIDDHASGGAGLTYHGGRKWSGYGGPAYGDQAAQRRAAVRALGEGSEAQGKKRLARLNELLTQVQAEHDAEFPPTRDQAKRRR